jgi:hypothetical protein
MDGELADECDSRRVLLQLKRVETSRAMQAEIDLAGDAKIKMRNEDSPSVASKRVPS